MSKTKRTNLFILDQELWEWAKYQGRTKGQNISEYIFELIKKDNLNM